MKHSTDELNNMRKTLGYSNKVELIDFKLVDGITIVLIKTGSMSYFSPSGRARLKMINIYRIDTLELEVDYNELDSKRFDTKRDAMNYYKHLLHCIKLANNDRLADKSINYGTI